MAGPEDFDSPVRGCFLELVPGEKVVWTTALIEDYRPASEFPHGCGAFVFTAIMTFEDAAGGGTLYRAVALQPFTPAQRALYSAQIDRAYTRFIGEVAAGLREKV